MRIVILKGPLRRALRWLQRGLLGVGLVLLGYSAFALVDGWVFQYREDRHLKRLLLELPKAAAEVRQTTTTPTSAKVSPPVIAGGLIGRIDIPRLGLSAIVVEGISRSALRRAVGHIPGTSMPGDHGNTGISGHRDTFFRPLRNIRPSDIITLTTPRGEYRYRVMTTRIVLPNDITVLDPGETETLTLVTCYPFYFVGPAPERFIVHAERIV